MWCSYAQMALSMSRVRTRDGQCGIVISAKDQRSTVYWGTSDGRPVHSTVPTADLTRV